VKSSKQSFKPAPSSDAKGLRLKLKRSDPDMPEIEGIDLHVVKRGETRTGLRASSIRHYCDCGNPARSSHEDVHVFFEDAAVWLVCRAY
jgi:hypothetical protein